MLRDLNPPPLRFLCVNVDHNFIAYLLATAEPINLSLDTCKSINDARQKIKTTSYEAYIIDVSGPDLGAFDLIQDIRHNNEKKHPIAVIVESSHSEERVRSLKEKQEIDYVLQKPISPQQIDILLTELCQRYSTAKTIDPKSSMQELKRSYEKTIYSKIELLTKLVKALQKDAEPETLNELKNAIHKIGGSAGSYGYEAVSTLCKEMDRQITEIDAAGKRSDKIWLSTLDDFLSKIKLAFQTSSQSSSQSFIVSSLIPRPSIFVIDHDIKFLKLLERINEQFPIELYVESDPKIAMERLHAFEFNPRAIIVSQTFPGSKLRAYNIIEAQRGKQKQEQPVFAIILDQDTLDIRMEALQKGVNYIFHRPLSAYLLLRSMKDALEIQSLHNFRVLVLDDDVDFCNFVSIMLTEIGLNVRTIQASHDLFKTLEEFHPQILLLDLVLPKYDGLKLLNTLRQDISYNNVIVVIVTSSEEPETRIAAYTAKADDILYKPLDKEVLQKRILNLIERHASFGQLPENQDITGFVRVRALTAKLHECLQRPGPEKHSMALFEIDHYADWVKQKGTSAAHDLIISISNQLQWEMDTSTGFYAYNASKFAIVFDSNDIKGIEKKMYAFLTEIAEKESSFNVSFNCCIIPVSKSFGNAQEVLQKAEQCIYDARLKQPALVKMVVFLPKEEHLPKDERLPKDEVVIVDPDIELLKILKTSFEAHGIIAKTFVDGEQALKELLTYSENHPPALTIVERKLPDMDGLDLFNRLQEKFQGNYPLYFLTVYGSDKDISDGLREGALEYITKPFNISLLIQKALKTISKKE